MQGLEETSYPEHTTSIMSLNHVWISLFHLLDHVHVRRGPPCVNAPGFEEIICEHHKPKWIPRLYLRTADSDHTIYSNSHNNFFHY